MRPRPLARGRWIAQPFGRLGRAFCGGQRANHGADAARFGARTGTGPGVRFGAGAGGRAFCGGLAVRLARRRFGKIGGRGGGGLWCGAGDWLHHGGGDYRSRLCRGRDCRRGLAARTVPGLNPFDRRSGADRGAGADWPVDPRPPSHGAGAAGMGGRVCLSHGGRAFGARG